MRRTYLSRVMTAYLLITVPFMMARFAVASTHYIAANGSDSNTGTSNTAPWLHAPGMPKCSATCASYTPVAGDQFIFRGGDTWHLGNSSATPYVGAGGWAWNWAGSAGSPIYIGVDQTWFSGASWSRPILTGDNPLTKSPVASCTYDESSLAFVSLNVQNVTFDNFEFLGGCWHGTQNGYGGPCCLNYIGKGQPPNPVNIIIENTYMHGWSHVTFSCGSGGTRGNCDGGQGISGDSHSNGGQGNQIVGVVIDGSDSDPTSFAAILWECYDVHNSVIRYNSNGLVCNNMHTFHDNLIEFISESSDGQTHSNGFEFNSEWAGTNTVYNNVVRHLTTAVSGWVNPNQADYYFNNVTYDTLGQNWDIDLTGGGTGNWYNNTNDDAFFGSPPGSWNGVFKNNIFIDSGSLGTPASNVDPITWTSAQATAAGFTAGSVYAYQPTSPNCNGQLPCPQGSGANLTSSCGTVPSLCSDTTYACSYNTSTHSVSCPARTVVARPSSGAWDIGAYEYNDPPGPPAPPTNLVATPQ